MKFNMNMEKLKFPIGRFAFPDAISNQQLDGWIKDIEALPGIIEGLVGNMPQQALDNAYRPEGWTIKQVVHHLADSHINSLIRFKWALTENNPTIKTYDQPAWAETPDVLKCDVELSIMILKGIHSRWGVLLRNMSPEDFKRTFVHPEMKRTISLEQNTALYAWHGRHHIEHIKLALG